MRDLLKNLQPISGGGTGKDFRETTDLVDPDGHHQETGREHNQPLHDVGPHDRLDSAEHRVEHAHAAHDPVDHVHVRPRYLGKGQRRDKDEDRQDQVDVEHVRKRDELLHRRAEAVLQVLSTEAKQL